MKKITQEFINHVKLLSSQSTIPPTYNPDEWHGSFNCYHVMGRFKSKPITLI